MSAMAIGAGIGGIFGAFTASRSLREQNNAIAAEAAYNVEKYKMQKTLTEFSQANNMQRASEITAQIRQEASVASRKVSIETTQAVSTATIQRGEGVTAGASVMRSVDDVLRQGAEAQGNIDAQLESAIQGVEMGAWQANAQEQARLINSYNELRQNNAMLASKIVSGTDAMLAIASQALSGAQSGASLGGAFDKLSAVKPSGSSFIKIPDNGGGPSVANANQF